MEIAVIMPSIDRESSEKTMRQLIETAGMDANFMVVMDNKRTGFVSTVNDFVSKTNYKYYVYTAQDAYGGKDWLKIAYETLEDSKKSLFAFNDGKWKGKMASFGMVRRDWKAPFFFQDYDANYADVELSLQAISADEMVTDLRSIMIEVDYNKTLPSVADKNLFDKRRSNNFDHSVSSAIVDTYV